MRYETPNLSEAAALYESPILLDVAQMAAVAEAADWCVCVTSGSNDAAAADRVASPDAAP